MKKTRTSLRLTVFHWNEAEAEARAAALRAEGHEARAAWHMSGDAWRALRTDPPDCICVDLSRMPSHAILLGRALRTSGPRKTIPVLFVEGDESRRKRVSEALPGAQLGAWSSLVKDVARARAAPPPKGLPRQPVVSAKPLHAKLGIAPASKVALVDAPPAVLDALREVPDVRAVEGFLPATVTLAFYRSRRDLAEALPDLHEAAGRSRLWIGWPKRTGTEAHALGMPDVMSLTAEHGLTGAKIASVDEAWSAVWFVQQRIEDEIPSMGDEREGPASATKGRSRPATRTRRS